MTDKSTKQNQSSRAVKMRSTLAFKAAERRDVHETLAQLRMRWRDGLVPRKDFTVFARLYGAMQAQALYWEGAVDVLVCNVYPDKVREAYSTRTNYIPANARMKILLVYGSDTTQCSCNYWFA